MTRDDAFAVHMVSLFCDAINNHTGSLRCCATGISAEAKDDFGKPMRDRLSAWAEDLQKKLARAKKDITEFVGGEDRYKQLKKEDFDSSYTLSANLWRTQTYKQPPTEVEWALLYDQVKTAMLANDKAKVRSLIEDAFYKHGRPSLMARIAAQLALEVNSNAAADFCQIVEEFGI